MNKRARFTLLAVLIAVVVFVLIFAALSVGTPGKTNYKDEQRQAIGNNVVDSAISLVRDGDVVLRMGVGVYSQLIARINKTAKDFSHCGIVKLEDGYPFVYHSIGGEDNPDARLRRDSAGRFFDLQHNTAFAIVRYDLNSTQLKALDKAVEQIYLSHPRFDTKFDLSDTGKLYCTEFVAKALALATSDSGYIPMSIALGQRFIGIDNLYINNHAHMIWRVNF
jgi:hypothetical protein